MSNLSMTKVDPRVNSEVNPEDIYHLVNVLDHSDMDVKETRRKRLRELIDSRYGGKQAAFAADIERQPDYVSRCLKGTKNIGEDLARIIEKRVRLPLGWLDRDHAEEGRDTGGAESAPEVDVLTVLRRMEGRVTPKSKAALLRLEKLAIEGKLSDEDWTVIEQIVSRFERARAP